MTETTQTASTLERAASQGDTFQRALAIVKRWNAVCGCTYAGSIDSWEPCREHDVALALATMGLATEFAFVNAKNVTPLEEPRSQSGRVTTYVISPDVAADVREGSAAWPAVRNVQGTETVAMMFPRLLELSMADVKQRDSRKALTSRGHSGRADAARKRSQRTAEAKAVASHTVDASVTSALSRAR